MATRPELQLRRSRSVRKSATAASNHAGVGALAARRSIVLLRRSAEQRDCQRRFARSTSMPRGSLTHPRLSSLQTVRNFHLKLVTPTEVNRTVAPVRRPNAELRTREHLTPGEVEALVETAKANRYGHRDATMILVAFRHGLRAAEACDLRWDQVDFNGAVLHVRRVKNGTPSTHPLHGDELRALRRLQRESETSPFVFVSERGSPFTTAGFARMIERAAAAAGLELKAHPHNAAPRLRLRPRQQGPRHPCDPGMARPSVDHEHRGLHGLGAQPVQGLLAGLMRRVGRAGCWAMAVAEDRARCAAILSITVGPPGRGLAAVRGPQGRWRSAAAYWGTAGTADGLHRESRSIPSRVSYRSNFFHARHESRGRRLTQLRHAVK
jgi:site-specific recombinase XerC